MIDLGDFNGTEAFCIYQIGEQANWLLINHSIFNQPELQVYRTPGPALLTCLLAFG